MAVTSTTPKPKKLLTKIVNIARDDSSTEKVVLPKDSVVVSVVVNQTVNASTAAATFVLGWSGSTSALLSAFTMATTKVGQVHPGTATGASVGTKLDSDKMVLSTYTVGSSTAGGTGYVIISYYIAGPGETIGD